MRGSRQGRGGERVELSPPLIGRPAALVWPPLTITPSSHANSYVPNSGAGLKRCEGAVLLPSLVPLTRSAAPSLDYRTQQWDSALQAFLEEKRKEKPVVRGRVTEGSDPPSPSA